MSIEKGQQAPVITLYDTEKNKVALNEYRGKNVVLLFFPLAFTSVCTKELCSVQDNISMYNDLQAVIFGISVDSLYTLKKFKEEQGINFTLLSDFNREASKAYGVLYDIFPAFDMQGVSKRAVFILDKTGIVQYAEVCATPGDMPDFSKINRTLELLNS